MVLDELALPLTRAWCLFEVLQTLILSQGDQGFGGLHFCTSTGVINQGQSGTDVAMATAKRLASLDLREAQATNAEDQRTIRELVEQMPGGFDAVNAFVRGSIRQAPHGCESELRPRVPAVSHLAVHVAGLAGRGPGPGSGGGTPTAFDRFSEHAHRPENHPAGQHNSRELWQFFVVAHLARIWSPHLCTVQLAAVTSSPMAWLRSGQDRATAGGFVQ